MATRVLLRVMARRRDDEAETSRLLWAETAAAWGCLEGCLGAAADDSAAAGRWGLDCSAAVG